MTCAQQRAKFGLTNQAAAIRAAMSHERASSSAKTAIGDDAGSGAGGNSRPHADTRAGTITARG